MFVCTVIPANTISSQDIRYHPEKQDTPGVLWGHGVDEVGCLARVNSFQAWGGHRPSSDPNRGFREPLRDLFKPQV